MAINTSYDSLVNQINITSGSVDVKSTIKGFWNEMSKLMADYAALSFDPDPEKSMAIGSTIVTGDKVSSPATSLLLEDRTAKIDQTMQSMLNILSQQFKLADRIANQVS